MIGPMTECEVRLTESNEDRGDPTLQKLSKYDAKITFENYDELNEFVKEINDEYDDGTYYEKEDDRGIADRILVNRSNSVD